MLHVRQAGAFGGLFVGGSHGSLEWSALRFISSEGLVLRANQAARAHRSLPPGLLPPGAGPGHVRRAHRHELLRAPSPRGHSGRRRRGRPCEGAQGRGGSRGRRVRPDAPPAGGPGLRVVTVDAGAEVVCPAQAGARRSEPGRAGELVRDSGRTWALPRMPDADRLVVVDEHGHSARPRRDRGPRRPALARAPGGARRGQRLDQPHGGRRRRPLRVSRAPRSRRRSPRGRGHEGARGGGGWRGRRRGDRPPRQPLPGQLRVHGPRPEVDGRLGADGQCAARPGSLLLDGEGAPPLSRPGRRPFAPPDQEPLPRGAARPHRRREGDVARPLAARPLVGHRALDRLEAEAPTEEEARSLVNRVLEVLSPGA